MSTFVVRFVGIRTGAFRGKVRHVRTGEECSFCSSSELLGFFERMNATYRENPEMEPSGGGACASPPGESPVATGQDRSATIRKREDQHGERRLASGAPTTAENS